VRFIQTGKPDQNAFISPDVTEQHRVAVQVQTQAFT